MTALIVIYALTSIIGGYYSGSYYSKYRGKNWIRTMVFTACLFPLVTTVIGLFVNFFAIVYQAQTAVPFGTMCAMAAIWMFVTVPLVFIGTIIGRNIAGASDFPCRVT